MLLGTKYEKWSSSSCRTCSGGWLVRRVPIETEGIERDLAIVLLPWLPALLPILLLNKAVAMREFGGLQQLAEVVLGEGLPVVVDLYPGPRVVLTGVRHVHLLRGVQLRIRQSMPQGPRRAVPERLTGAGQVDGGARWISAPREGPHVVHLLV
eukprot:CAMPEP_0183403218 /NCGR_PEP_ID=MMETSP0370-20130417/14432_1 /TAXON_ID=268820 /ORGANISM="Peridinium aciculiferum, Strain PAER-2" /LENGTH=152 /DNA_ID=CAMNT_0025584933 /DNA_START=287 /DNA_END=741 /DNA_ORIENTATION=+